MTEKEQNRARGVVDREVDGKGYEFRLCHKGVVVHDKHRSREKDRLIGFQTLKDVAIGQMRMTL